MRVRVLGMMTVALLAASSLTACGGKQVQPSPYVEGNYPGHFKIGQPYEIDGRQYIPAHEPHYVEEGVASWYGPGFHGRSTANGERFDQYAMTAAHRTLPMPSMVRVTNLENGRSEVLLVNDRGPFKKDRIIDLSKAAAEKLGVINRGTAQVRVEYLPDETRRMLQQLVANNTIRPTADARTLLALHNIPHEMNAGAVASAPVASTGGISLAGSAYAAEPQRGVVERAPLGHVSSREVAELSPMHNPAHREEMRIARADSAVPHVKQPQPMRQRSYGEYDQGGLMPAVMPESSAYVPEPVAAPPALTTHDGVTTSQQAVSPQAVAQYAYAEPVVQHETTAASAVNSGIFIQAGSFSEPQNAHNLSQRLSDVGRTVVKPVEISGRTWYRVKIGPLADASAAQYTLQNLQSMGLRDARVVTD